MSPQSEYALEAALIDQLKGVMVNKNRTLFLGSLPIKIPLKLQRGLIS
jgi:hypothetical protein